MVTAAGTLIKFTEKSTGESFTVKAGAAWGPDVTTKVNAQTNVANAITTLFTNAVFAQTRDLTINGDLIVSASQVLTLQPIHPLPSGVATGSFAVSASAPPRPYMWDGSSWYAL